MNKDDSNLWHESIKSEM
jgi:hypothetical protein